jgi:hypothetical protein
MTNDTRPNTDLLKYADIFFSSMSGNKRGKMLSLLCPSITHRKSKVSTYCYPATIIHANHMWSKRIGSGLRQPSRSFHRVHSSKSVLQSPQACRFIVQIPEGDDARLAYRIISSTLTPLALIRRKQSGPAHSAALSTNSKLISQIDRPLSRALRWIKN